MKFSVKKLALMGILTALSLIIFIVEAQFPPIGMGGIKLGLANIVTLVSMTFVGRREAGGILLARIVLASAFYGTFISFLFSLTGGIFAYAVMCFMLNKLDRKQLWAVSVFGGVSHNIGQLIVAAAVTGTSAVAALAPYLIISGVITGAFNGVTAQKLWFSSLKKYASDFGLLKNQK